MTKNNKVFLTGLAAVQRRTYVWKGDFEMMNEQLVLHKRKNQWGEYKIRYYRDGKERFVHMIAK